MKSIKLLVCLLLAIVLPRFAFADLVGPYTPDANTLFLLHFDGPAGSTVATNNGSKSGNFYSVNEVTGSTTPPLVNTMLGAAGYVNGPTNFNSCMTNPTVGYLFGYDFNKSGAYQGDVSSSVQSADRLAMTNLNIGFGGQSPFTLEALIQPTTNGSGLPSGEIICTDNNQGTSGRGFQFRITTGGRAGVLQFQAIATSQAISGSIPTNGPDAFVPGTWYHVALTYDGAKATLYWTKLDPEVGAAHVLSSGALALAPNFGVVQGPLCIGNENRGSAAEQFLGCIDEVRISSVCRAANQMQNHSVSVSLTQNPVSQNVDYNESVSFSVGATSDTALGYQWRFNSNSIAGETNSTYTIPNVAAGNAGYYDVVVTNTAGYASTSSPALLIVGAANFLTHRYSFTTDVSDSVGGADGTLLGAATVAGGALVLDGTTGTYAQLPGNLFNGANASALTFEFWATFGANANNCRVFDFGFTNSGSGNGFNYVAFTPHSASGHQALITPGDVIFQQTADGAGTLDGLTRHIACVVDPPNKTLAIYTNGVLESVNTNMTVNISSLNDTLSFLGRSLFSASPYLNASVDEFRIYSGALSGISLKQSNDQGPNTVLADGPGKFISQPVSLSVPVGQTATFTAAAVGYLPINYQWFTNGTPVPDATNASYSFATVMGDNNASIVCHATNVIGTTTYVTNSDTVTLTVFLPPTLAWLGTAAGGQDNSWNDTSLDWTNDLAGGGVLAFAQTNGVLFDDRSGGGSVDLEQTIIPYGLTVNAASDYTLTSAGQLGALAGAGFLTKLNSGTLTIDLTNNLSGPTTISGGKLQVGNFDSYGTLGTGPVTNNATLSFNRYDAVLNVGNALHGSGLVSFDGGGAVTLSGISDYSGSTLINQGIVYLTSSTGLGATSSGTAVANGAQVYVTANVDVAEPLTLNGSGPASNGALRKGGAGITTDNGPVYLNTDAAIGVDGGATLILSNQISGAAILTAVGSGTLTLATNNTLNGFVLNGPVVSVQSAGALGANPVTISGPGRFVIGTGLNFTNAVTANVISSGAGSLGLLMVNDNTNGTVTTVSGPLTFNGSPANGGNFAGPTSSGYLNVTAPITNTVTGVIQSRAGLVRFSGGGNCDYTLLNVNQGTASLGADNGICPNAALVFPGSGDATFDLNGFSQTLTGLSDAGTFLRLVTNSLAATSTLTLNLSSSGAYNGLLAGNLALVVNGAGSLLLSATNSYTGNTTVNGGLLELAQPGLAANSTVTVASGATLQLDFAGTNSVAGLVLNGSSQAPGVYTSTTSPTYILGSGSLLVATPVATNPTNLVVSVSGNQLSLSWPADHLGWTLQTNSLDLANTNDWFPYPGSATLTNVVISIDPAQPQVFYRLTYP